MHELQGNILVDGKKLVYTLWRQDNKLIPVTQIDELKKQTEKQITQWFQWGHSRGILSRENAKYLDGEVEYKGLWFCAK